MACNPDVSTSVAPVYRSAINVMFRHGVNYRTECSMMPHHAVSYAREDRILSPEALELWASFISGDPPSWNRALANALNEIVDSPYTIVASEYDDEGFYNVAVIHDRPVNVNRQSLYWGPTEEQELAEALASRLATAETIAAIRQGKALATTRVKGVIYVMSSPKFNAVKIGISDAQNIKSRISDHVSHGWNTERSFSFPDKQEARKAEQEILKNFWMKGFTSPVTPIDMPQGGSTEVFRLADVSVQRMIEEVEARR